MNSAPKQRLQALSEQLVVKPADPGTFENIPKIRRIAPDSAGPYGSLFARHPIIDRYADKFSIGESRTKSS